LLELSGLDDVRYTAEDLIVLSCFYDELWHMGTGLESRTVKKYKCTRRNIRTPHLLFE
jgi:hypothetical protein